jgi:hypothetical protein
VSEKPFRLVPIPQPPTTYFPTSPSRIFCKNSPMATSDNIWELTRTVTILKETKITLNFKLNLLRSSAASSLANPSTFEGLVDRLADAGSKIWVMGERIKDMESNMGEAVFWDGDSDEVWSALKETVALGATLDALGEEIMRLEFSLEAPQTSIADRCWCCSRSSRI